MYRTLQTIHLLCGAFAVPMLLMYSVSAIQMAHPKWFSLKPAVTESMVPIAPGLTDGRAVAREVMARARITGEIAEIKPYNGDGSEIRIVVPGTVHEIRYQQTTGKATVRTSVGNVFGMLNRLHHAAGIRREYIPLSLWGAFSGLASLATLTLGMTGLWMWWKRQAERTWGLIFLTANLLFSVALLTAARMAGP